ncbi:Ldh family oxidoreductase [Candidatus Pelagibacter sp.]|nr:Ldh family oxidoreductase [Candidatus Pelagibacter sp.]
MKKVNFSKINKFVQMLFIKIGMKRKDAEKISYCLCETSLRGIDSHGIKLVPHYIKSGIFGRKNPNPKFKVKMKYTGILTLDANNAFGHIAGLKAIDIGIKKANKLGICAVSVINSTHPGAMGSIALRASERGYICFAFTHADSLIRSTNGKRPYFGTNPICFTAPRKNDAPYCLDMSSSIISWNKLMEIRKIKKKSDIFYGSNYLGKDTKYLNDIVSLLPTGDYKGFALASMIEILCGIYSGMNFGRQIASMYKTSVKKKRYLSQFYILLKVDGVISKNNFLSRMQKLSKQVRSEPKLKSKKKVMLPNDPELKISNIRFSEGIPISNELFLEFKKLSSKYKIAF